jgi:hypothetical protein
MMIRLQIIFIHSGMACYRVIMMIFSHALGVVMHMILSIQIGYMINIFRHPCIQVLMDMRPWST